MDFNKRVIDIAHEFSEEIAQRLRIKGVDESIIEYAISGSDEPSSPPPRRMLKPVTEDHSSHSHTQSDNGYTPREKFPQDYSNGDVVLVTNYSPKSHALFGDFKETYKNFRTTVLLSEKDLFSYNEKLVFGPGWIIRNKSKLDFVKAQLKRKSIKFREIELDAYLAEVQNPKKSSNEVEEEPESDVDSPSEAESPEETSSSEAESDVDEPVPEPAKAVSKSKAKTKPEPPKAEPKKSDKTSSSGKTSSTKTPSKKADPPKEDKSKSKISKNEWGNNESDGIVYLRLPIGKNGKDLVTAIGYQDPVPPKGAKGLETVIPFEEGDEELTTLKRCLTRDMLSKIEKYDDILASQLQQMFDREDEEDDELVDSDDDSDDDELDSDDDASDDE